MKNDHYLLFNNNIWGSILNNLLDGWSFELDLEDLPLFGEELAFWVAGEGETGLGGADVFAVVVADGELGVWTFFVAVVHHADVAAAEDGSFVWVVCDGKLG